MGRGKIDAATFFANLKEPRAFRDIFYTAIKTGDFVKVQQGLTALKNTHGDNFVVEDDMDRTIVPDFYLRTRAAADMFGRRSLSLFHEQVAAWPTPDNFRPFLSAMFRDSRFHHLIYPMVSFVGAYYDTDWDMAMGFHADQAALRVRGQFVYDQDYEKRLAVLARDLLRDPDNMVRMRLVDLAAGPEELQAMGVISFMQHLGVFYDFDIVKRDVLRRIYMYYKENNNTVVMANLAALSQRFPVMGGVPRVGPRLSHPDVATIVNTTHPMLVNVWYPAYDFNEKGIDLTPEAYLTTKTHKDWECADEESMDVGDYTYYYITDGDGHVVPVRRVNAKTKVATYNVCVVPLAIVNARRLTAASRERPEVEAEANICRFVSTMYKKMVAQAKEGRFADPNLKYQKVSLDVARLDEFDVNLDADVGALTALLARSAIGITSVIDQRIEMARVVEEVPMAYDRAVADAVLRGIIFGCYAHSRGPGAVDRPLGQYPYLTLSDYPVAVPKAPLELLLIAHVLGLEALPAPEPVRGPGMGFSPPAQGVSEPRIVETRATLPGPAPAPFPPLPGAEAILTELDRRRIEIKHRQDILRKAEEDRLAALQVARDRRAAAPRTLPPPARSVEKDDTSFDGNAVAGVFLAAETSGALALVVPVNSTTGAHLDADAQRGSPITRIDPTLYSPNAILKEMHTEVLRWHPPLEKRYAGLNRATDRQYDKRPWTVVEMAAADAMFYMSQYATLARLAVVDILPDYGENLEGMENIDYTVPPYRMEAFRKLVALLATYYTVIHPVVKVVPEIKFGLPIEADTAASGCGSDGGCRRHPGEP
jgi:hypothetical protein